MSMITSNERAAHQNGLAGREMGALEPVMCHHPGTSECHSVHTGQTFGNRHDLVHGGDGLLGVTAARAGERPDPATHQ